MKIYTFIADPDDGLQVRLFANEAERDAAVWSWVALYFNAEGDLRTVYQLRLDYTDYFEAWEDFGHDSDRFNCTVEELDLTNTVNRSVGQQNYCSSCGRDYRDLPLGQDETCLCAVENEYGDLNMKIKIKTYLVVVNIDCELTFHQFQTEQEANDKAWAIVRSLFEESSAPELFDDFVSEYDDDLNTCWVELVGGNNDTLNVEEFEVEVPPPFSARERGTVLAALRYWQKQGYPDGPELQEIASDVKPLNLEEIDALCERLNS